MGKQPRVRRLGEDLWVKNMRQPPDDLFDAGCISRDDLAVAQEDRFIFYRGKLGPSWS